MVASTNEPTSFARHFFGLVARLSFKSAFYSSIYKKLFAAITICASLVVSSDATADTALDTFFDELRRHEQREEDRSRRAPTPDVRLQPETERAEAEGTRPGNAA